MVVLWRGIDGAWHVWLGIGGVVFGIRYARGAYAGSMVGWVSVAAQQAGVGMRVAGLGCGKKGEAGGRECVYFRSIWRRWGIE